MPSFPEERFPDAFVHCAEEPSQRLVLGGVVLPQIASPALARKDPANEHNLDHVDKFDLLSYHVLDARLEPRDLIQRSPGQALLLPGGKSQWSSGSKFGGCCPIGVARLDNVKPPRLPSLHRLREGAFGPGDIGHFAHHGASALYLLTAHHLRFHVGGLQL